MSYAQGPAASWYAATVRGRSDYPVLRGRVRADVAVVGAGFTGVSTALHLAERGYDVVLLEAERVGYGASGRNGGQLIGGFVDVEKIRRRAGDFAARVAWEAGLEGRDIVVRRIERHGIECDLRFGLLELALKDRELPGFETTVEGLKRRGYPHGLHVLGRQALREYVGSERYAGGLLNDGGGHLQPLDLVVGEARAAAALGVRVFESSRVVRVRHGAQPAVDTAEGGVDAAKIVLAGNAYLGRAEPRLAGRVIPAGSYMIATEPLGPALAGRLLPRNSACYDTRAALDYFRLTPDLRLLFGGLCNYSGREPRDIDASLRPKLSRVFPELAGVRFDYRWGGLIAISVDRIPQFGRIEGNTYYAQGYSGHGVAPTHVAGKMLADAIAGDSERFDVFAKLKHWRLPGGRWFANPALALGMTWYRLKELL